MQAIVSGMRSGCPAMNKARSLQNYSGAKLDYNVLRRNCLNHPVMAVCSLLPAMTGFYVTPDRERGAS